MTEDIVNQDAPPPPRRRLQFSLFSLLMLVVMFGAVMGLWFSQRETNRLRVENRKLREELGVLNVDDPTKVYARSLPVNESLKWRWRVYFPAARKYKIKLQEYGILESGFPGAAGSSMTFTAEKGEFMFEAQAKVTTPGRVDVSLLIPGGRMTSGAASTAAGFDDWASGPSSSSGLPTASIAYDPDKPLELLRVRAMKQIAPGSSSSTSAPSPGLLIWIEPDPLPASAAPAAGTPSSNAANGH